MSRPDGDGECATMGCPNPGTSRGTYADGEVFARVAYCLECAAAVDAFTPDEPAAPAAEADLREQIVKEMRPAEPWPGAPSPETIADYVLALPALQRLVEQAAEAARLRVTVARVGRLADSPRGSYVSCRTLRIALGGNELYLLEDVAREFGIDLDGEDTDV